VEEQMSSLRANLQLAFTFVLGLGAGIWTFIAPWVIPYPTSNGTWTSSIWAAEWVGAIVTAASAIGLVTVLAMAAADAMRAQRTAVPSPPDIR
jgi:hypothetical protein